MNWLQPATEKEALKSTQAVERMAAHRAVPVSAEPMRYGAVSLTSMPAMKRMRGLPPDGRMLRADISSMKSVPPFSISCMRGDFEPRVDLGEWLGDAVPPKELMESGLPPCTAGGRCCRCRFGECLNWSSDVSGSGSGSGSGS